MPAGTFKALKLEVTSAEGEPGKTTAVGRERYAQGREGNGYSATDGRCEADSRAREDARHQLGDVGTWSNSGG